VARNLVRGAVRNGRSQISRWRSGSRTASPQPIIAHRGGRGERLAPVGAKTRVRATARATSSRGARVECVVRAIILWGIDARRASVRRVSLAR
jgi:hypothetical protein